ncbi:MAG TPA: hypothetical protein VF798_04850 [Burkholderiaceae bacterium]
MNAVHAEIGRHFEVKPLSQTREFADLMEAMHEQIDADRHAGQDISTAFVEAQYDAADDNVLMFKAMSKACSDEELGRHVRLLMLRVARERVAS